MCFHGISALLQGELCGQNAKLCVLYMESFVFPVMFIKPVLRVCLYVLCWLLFQERVITS